MYKAVTIRKWNDTSLELVGTFTPTSDLCPIAFIPAIRDAIAVYDIGTQFPLGSWHVGEVVECA